MAIGFFIDPVFFNIGTGSFFNSFFSTIYIKLENSDWGEKFPIIMNSLYNGSIPLEEIGLAQKEVKDIRKELSELPPSEIVWDFEDLTVLPPWGNNISSEIKNMADYFVTSDGHNLLDILEKALNASLELGKKLEIRSL